jgi:hypothetical protein
MEDNGQDENGIDLSPFRPPAQPGPTLSTAHILPDPLTMLSNASSTLNPLPPFDSQVTFDANTFGGPDLDGHHSTSWTASMFDDVLLDFPLFPLGGEATAFLSSLQSSDYYGAAPSTFASPVATIAASLTEEEDGSDLPIVRIRHAEQIFEEIHRLCPIRPDGEDPIQAGVTAAVVGTTEEGSFDSIRAVLQEKPDFQAVAEPSSSFLATSLRLFWRHLHSLFPVLHRPSFRTCDHHPLLLLAMCASGATAMVRSPFYMRCTYHSAIRPRPSLRPSCVSLCSRVPFIDHPSQASAVFRKLLLTVPKRFGEATGLRQRHDLLFVALLTARYGTYSGQREWLSSVVGLHGSCLAYARQLQLFNRGGAYRLFRKTKHIPVAPELWDAWIAHESSTRLANSILLHDDWCARRPRSLSLQLMVTHRLHSVVRDQQPPLACASSRWPIRQYLTREHSRRDADLPSLRR